MPAFESFRNLNPNTGFDSGTPFSTTHISCAAERCKIRRIKHACNPGENNNLKKALVLDKQSVHVHAGHMLLCTITPVTEICLSHCVNIELLHLHHLLFSCSHFLTNFVKCPIFYFFYSPTVATVHTILENRRQLQTHSKES